MQPLNEEEFQDPALKDAVQRCWACDCAPAELREKISKLIGRADGVAPSSAAGKSHPRQLRNMPWAIWPIAVAAAVLLAVGLFREFQQRSPRTELVSAIPVSLEHDLIFRHDECCARPSHQHLAVPITDDAAIQDALHAKLHRPVVVFHPQDPGWQFRGAAVCPVGTISPEHMAEHLVFVKNAASLSVFGLPNSMLPGARDGTDYSTSLDQHNIVAFVKNGALFCLVSAGTDGMDIDGLKKIESQMSPSIAQSNMPMSSQIVLTELLRPASP